MSSDEFIRTYTEAGHTPAAAKIAWSIITARKNRETFSLYVIAVALLAALDQISRRQNLDEGGMTTQEFAAWVLAKGIGFAAGLALVESDPGPQKES